MRMRFLIWSSPVLAGLALFAGAVRAEPIDEIEHELAAADKGEEVLALAQQQADAGQLLEALASAERARFLDPKLKQARLMHAVLLCRIDDPQGAAIEWNALDKGDFKKKAWKSAKASCPALFGGGD